MPTARESTSPFTGQHRGDICVVAESDTRRIRGPAVVSRLVSASVVAILAVVVVVIWWARNRGLDLTDEGYYLQLYAHPDAAPPDVVFSQFYLLVDFMTGNIDTGIVGYRTLALFLLVTSGAFLGLSLHRFLRSWLPEVDLPPLPATVAFVAVSALLGYAWAPLAVSYNTLAATLISVATGCTLLAVADRERTRLNPRSIALASLAGALLILKYRP